MRKEKTMISLINLLPLIECWELRRLSKMARNGWFLKDFKNPVQYTFIQKEPEEICYRIAYQEHPSDAFLTELQEHGWKKVLQIKDLYLLSGIKGTKPKTVDLRYRISKFHYLRIDAVKTLFMALIPILFAYFWLGRVTSDTWILIARLFMGVTFIPLLIALAQVIGYSLKLVKLHKGVICHDETC